MEEVVKFIAEVVLEVLLRLIVPGISWLIGRVAGVEWSVRLLLRVVSWFALGMGLLSSWLMFG